MMTHVEILPILHALYEMPRGQRRFERYLELLRGETDDVALPPLVPANPMAKEHVQDRITALLALDIERVAADAVVQAAADLECPPDLQHGLTIADDVMGGWTNRYTTEAAAWFSSDAHLKRKWVTTLLWASDLPSVALVQQEVRRSIYRAIHKLKHGRPETLGDMLRQEGAAARFAGLTPHLDAADLAYSIVVVRDLADVDQFPIQMACMYGDEAANLLGYPPQGLSHRAGFAAAIIDF